MAETTLEQHYNAVSDAERTLVEGAEALCNEVIESLEGLLEGFPEGANSPALLTVKNLRDQIRSYLQYQLPTVRNSLGAPA